MCHDAWSYNPKIKKLSFKNQIITSSNKVKTAWKIMNNNCGNSP